MRSTIRNLKASNELVSALARGQGVSDLRDIDGVSMSAKRLTPVSFLLPSPDRKEQAT